MNILSKTEFEAPIWEEVNKRPSYIRRGQAVFNATEEIYGVAREVQFKDRIDCFYDDSQIEAFLDAAYQRYLSHLGTNSN
jgi:hypothetical protein